MFSLGTLAVVGPILAAIIPALLNKGDSGQSPLGSLFGKIKGLFGNITGHASSTVSGAVGSGVLGTVIQAFPCLQELAGWQQIAIAAIPFIFGSLSGSFNKPVGPPDPPK